MASSKDKKIPESRGGHSWKNKLSEYVIALRPWSFSASLTPVSLGSALAYKLTGEFSVLIFIVSCVTTLSVHAAGNLVNTYCDYKRGVDSKKSDDRTLIDHILNPNDVATLGGIFYFVGLVGCFITVCLSSSSVEHLALVFFGGLSSSFLYTGGPALKYHALGDIVIFLTFGPITVLFAFLTQTGRLGVLPMVYAIPLAMNTEAILHSNNTRDMNSDQTANIVTLPILLGRTGSYVIFVALLFVPYVIFAVLSANFTAWFLLPVLTIPMAFDCERKFRAGFLKEMPQQIAKINLIFGLLYVLAILIAPASRIPGF
ncbi:ubiA prenyltransferase domain-containing protein 1-like [Tubulanus polymorphus]|uniref:ubiA prenyltransferase domain-containing protein 1-like n=1 Tax=Tubulanus polymorphus TaxID=672921 RepID=UPI003DA1EE42